MKMIYETMTLNRFFKERNLSPNTIIGYQQTITQFEEITGLTIDEMLHIAKEERNLEWEDTRLYDWLITYRNHVYNQYKEQTAQLYMKRVKAIFRHYHIRIYDLPYFSTKQTRKSEEIDYEDLPDKEMLKKCIEVKSPLLKAITLFISSSGFSKIDTLNLNIGTYLEATYDYHHSNDIYKAIELMDNLDVVPTFKLQRKKTGETYRTFASPEAVRAINIYLLSRDDDLSDDSPVFKVSESYLNDLFQMTNDRLGFGRVNDRRRFTPQMLRSFHASQLAEAGMTDSLIDLLQGRKPQSIARRHYIRVKREKLRSEYIRCLPFLVVEDINKVKSELELTKDELDNVNSENIELRNNLRDIFSRLESLEKLKPDR